MFYRKKYIYLKVLLLLFFATIVHFTYSQEKVPNFALYDYQGNRQIFYSILSELPENGIIILNFTSLYCPPCKKEIPELLSVVNSSKKHTKIIFIYSEDAKTIADDVAMLGIKPFAYTDVLGTIKNIFNIEKIPTTILINKNGYVIGRFTGYSDSNSKAIETLLKRKK